MENNPLKHPLWSPNDAAAHEVSSMHFARKRSRICWAAMLLSLAAGAYATHVHVKAILQPRAFVGVDPNGWVFSGQPVPFRTSSAQIQENWKQIIEAHFARTEKGSLPNLGAYSTADTAAAIDAILTRPTSGAFIVSLSVVEGRVEQQTADATEFHVRARLTVVDKNNTAPSEVFLSTVFVPGVGRPENPTGWRLAGLSTMTRDQFFANERASVRKGIFRPGAK